MATQPDHYAVLGLAHDASDAEIKRRYRKLMRQVHPDANTNDPDATRKAAGINRAFETLGNAGRRETYDRERSRRRGMHYAEWAEQEHWEDIVAESVPQRRPPHVHDPAPRAEPEEIEVDTAELDAQQRVRRTVTIVNRCDCTLRGDVATSEPWLWGPIGELTIPPGGSASFDVEIVSRKVTFPGVSRVLFVTDEEAIAVPVHVTGYRVRARRPHDTNSQYVPAPRRRRWGTRIT